MYLIETEAMKDPILSNQLMTVEEKDLILLTEMQTGLQIIIKERKEYSKEETGIYHRLTGEVSEEMYSKEIITQISSLIVGKQEMKTGHSDKSSHR